MFISFFYTLREAGVPVSPTAFLTLHRAMERGLVNSLDDFYVAARAILVKSERYFDLYDQVFAALFEGVELPAEFTSELDARTRAMLAAWLDNPRKTAAALGVDEARLSRLSPAELLDYFKKRLQDQQGRHDGGSKWIGTGGTSPVGHWGFHPGGLRVGGVSGGRTAVKVAGERRYRDYAVDAPLSRHLVGEALARLKNLVPQGAKDRLNVEASVRETIRNGGEIEMVFDRSRVDRLKIILAIDNGGWSMEPHVDIVQALFAYARAQFKDLQTCFFHNTIYDLVWEDATRRRKPVRIDELAGRDPETRLIVVGDASMAPYELMVPDGSIYAFEKSGRPSLERLRFLAASFPHCVWLNPVPARSWEYTRTINMIAAIFPMFELSLDGLDRAIRLLMRKEVRASPAPGQAGGRAHSPLPRRR